MKEIVLWLLGLEERARDIYKNAALVFANDPEISRFANRLGEEERCHADVIKKAVVTGATPAWTTPCVVLEQGTVKRIESAFTDCEKKLESKELTAAGFMDFVVTTEYSEWNELFLYVVNTMKTISQDFAAIAVTVQNHKKHIAEFLAKRPEFSRQRKMIGELPDLWDKSILAVDDEASIIAVMEAVLSEQGRVDGASNGREALEKMELKRYNAIVSDVNMPVMNGMDLYMAAVKKYPETKSRFLFISASYEENRPFFKEHGLKCLAKPSTMDEIKKAVFEILAA